MLRAYAVDDALTSDNREQLVDWLVANTTGDARVLAGVPGGWFVGDKTGTAFGYGARNDIAAVWPGGDRSAAPWVVVITTSRDTEDVEPVDALLAEATAVVVRELDAP